MSAICYTFDTNILKYTDILKETKMISLTDKRDLCITHILPIRDTLDIVSGKWKIPIIVALCVHRRRFKELHRDVSGITAKMLSKELKELEMNKLVQRTVHPTSPVTVEYSITEYGRSLTPLINELRDWGMKHRDKILHSEEQEVA